MMETIGHVIIAALMIFVLATLAMRFAGSMTADAFGRLWGMVAVPSLIFGLYLGLVWAPPDVLMGNVQRIMYVHFPSWVGTGAGYLLAFIASLAYLWKRKPTFDYWALAGVEVGLVFNAIGLITGSIWGRPTWGVWWTWDPRLTTTAIMFVTFAGYLVLRAFIEDPETRARAASLVAILGFVNVPIVYFSVQWWRTLHQPQSTPMSIAPEMVVALRVMMLTFLLLFGYLASRRYLLARTRGESEREAWELEAIGG